MMKSIPKMIVLSLTITLMASCEHDPMRHDNGAYRLADSIPWLAHTKGFDAPCLIDVSQVYVDSLTAIYYERFDRKNNAGFKTDRIYHYLADYYDSVGAKRVLDTDQFWGITEWDQDFEGGVYFRHIDHVEVGSGGEFRSRCSDKSAFLKIVAPFIEVDWDSEETGIRHVWRKDSTRYEPKDRGAGCYYKISRDSDSCYLMTWTCGC